MERSKGRGVAENCRKKVKDPRKRKCAQHARQKKKSTSYQSRIILAAPSSAHQQTGLPCSQALPLVFARSDSINRFIFPEGFTSPLCLVSSHLFFFFFWFLCSCKFRLFLSAASSSGRIRYSAHCTTECTK